MPKTTLDILYGVNVCRRNGGPTKRTPGFMFLAFEFGRARKRKGRKNTQENNVHK